MLRLGLLATLSALILTGCVSTYGYRTDQGGDYYYAEPSVDYYDGYGAPYGSLGYGYPGGWYGSIGYGFGFGGGYTPYSRHGFPYGYYGYRYGYPYSYYPHRRPQHHRPPYRPPPDTLPPGTLPPGVIDDHGPRFGDRDGGPWRHLERPRRQIMTPQPAIQGGQTPPGVGSYDVPPQRRRIMMPQPGTTGGRVSQGNAPQVRRAPVSQPGSVSEPRVRREPSQDRPAPQRRVQLQERESRRDPTP
jgi:hypothetical protein